MCIDACQARCDKLQVLYRNQDSVYSSFCYESTESFVIAVGHDIEFYIVYDNTAVGGLFSISPAKKYVQTIITKPTIVGKEFRQPWQLLGICESHLGIFWMKFSLPQRFQINVVFFALIMSIGADLPSSDFSWSPVVQIPGYWRILLTCFLYRIDIHIPCSA